MVRFCPNCQKDFDFNIKSTTDLDNLICPDCGGKIPANSRHKPQSAEATEVAIGGAFQGLYGISYHFYFVMSVIGIVAYFLNAYSLLYAMVIINMAVFVLQLLFGDLLFRTGLIFIPLGAALGYYFLQGLPGGALGILLAFAIRHLIRNVFWAFISKLIQAGNQ